MEFADSSYTFLLLSQVIAILFIATVKTYEMPPACRNVSATITLCYTYSFICPVSEREVYDKYFGDVQPWERPVKNSQRSVSISVRLVLFGINEISERHGSVRLTGFLNTRWQDEVHIWNNTMPYACMYSIHLGLDKTWIPELALLNSDKKYELVQSEGVEKVRIFSNGSVSYRPGGTYTAFCLFDVTYLPFDTQTCTLEFESWRYVTEVQKLTIGDPPISTRYWRENEQWAFTGGKYYKSLQNYLSDANYDHITFELTFQRKTGYYWLNVIIPSMIISFAQLSVFTLPLEEAIKVHVSFTCLLAYGVFQLMIIEDMPRSSDHIPLLSIYIDLSMSYIFLAICGLGLTFVCLRFADDKHLTRHVPTVVLFIARALGAFLLVVYPPALEKEPTERETTGQHDVVLAPSGQLFFNMFASQQLLIGDQQTAEQHHHNLLTTSASEKSAHQKSHYLQRVKTRQEYEWEYLASVIDRLTCVTYVIATIATPVIMFGILPTYFVKHQIPTIAFNQ